MQKHLRRWSLVFLIPGSIIYLFVMVYPVIRMFQFSFTNWPGYGPLHYIGLSNYIHLWEDPLFRASVSHTFQMMVGAMVIQIPLGFLIALVLYQKIPGFRIFRTVYFIPVILSTVVIGVLWTQIYDPSYGLLDGLLKAVGLGSWARAWIASPNTALWSIIVVVGWQYVGLYMVIFLSALQGIPSSILEAAEIDGATGWRKMIHITVPILLDTFKLSVILVVTGSVQYFNLIWLMTQGGPAGSTQVMASYMFTYAFSSGEFGYASASAAIMMIVSLLLTVVLQRLFRRDPLELA